MADQRGINQRILEKFEQFKKRSLPPMDDGQGSEELSGMPPSGMSGLPELRGSPKQIKWAVTIRGDALDLCWPLSTETLLRSVDDASWWIANRTLCVTLKFNEPMPHQRVGLRSPPEPALPPEHAGESLTLHADPPSEEAPSQSVRDRTDDAIAWAASVSRHPKMAEAAILAVLSRLYKDSMRRELKMRAEKVLAEADFEVGRDLEAINRMLT